MVASEGSEEVVASAHGSLQRRLGSAEDAVVALPRFGSLLHDLAEIVVKVAMRLPASCEMRSAEGQVQAALWVPVLRAETPAAWVPAHWT